MTVPPESIEAGKWYLITNGQVARVQNLQAGAVHYEFRSSVAAMAFGWTSAITDIRTFGHLIEREVPCDWTPEGEG